MSSATLRSWSSMRARVWPGITHTSKKPSTGEAPGVRLKNPRYVSTLAMVTRPALPGIAWPSISS
jgi:hypothetical protein